MGKKVLRLAILMALSLLISVCADSGNVWAASQANKEFTFTSVNGESVSTKTEPGKTTVIIFGRTTCGNTMGTVQSIAKSSWVGNSDIRVIFCEIDGASLSVTRAFASNYGCDAITFCYDDQNYYSSISTAMWEYFSMFSDENGGTLPFTVLIDKKDQVRNVLTGYQSADSIWAEISSYATSSGDTGESEKPEETEKPEEAKISDVSGLKAKSENSSVKLSWKKVSDAEGYFIYRYDSSGKKWKKIATVTAGKNSYTVKKLKSATGYRFGIKAYKIAGGKQVTSKSYASLYTATLPSAVKFNVTAGKRQATVKWSKVKGATGYEVLYRTGSKSTWKKLKSTKSLKYTKTKLKSGKTYTFGVRAYKVYKGKTYTGSFKGKKVKIR